MNDPRFRRDFETIEQYFRRLEYQDMDEDGDEAVEESGPLPLPSPWVVDVGPIWNSRVDERVIRRHEDRITKLDREDRGRG